MEGHDDCAIPGMMPPRCISCLAAAALFLPAAAPAAEEVHVISVPVLASELIGKPVSDAAGKALGEVEDVVLHLASNRARYAIVRLPERTIGVPIEMLAPSLERDRVILDAPRERLRRAPALTAARGYWGSVEAYWHAPAASELARASRLIGSRAVWDVLIDAHAGEVPFAIVSSGPDALHPVPLDALRVEDGNIALEVEPARSFTPKQLREGLTSNEFLRGNAAHAGGLTADRRPSDPPGAPLARRQP